MPNTPDSNKPNQASKGQKIAVVIFKLAAAAAFSLMGIAIFDRSRSINNGVVIAAGVFFAFYALDLLYEIGFDLKQVCAEPVTGHSQNVTC